MDMITDADIKKLSKVFATKDDLKDQKEQILDAVDGKLAIQKQEILEEMDTKLAKQKEEIIESVSEYIADAIVPVLDGHDKRISRVEKKLNLPPIAT
jgi:molecular chaperone GrpE (heat shock protein)